MKSIWFLGIFAFGLLQYEIISMMDSNTKTFQHIFRDLAQIVNMVTKDAAKEQTP